MSQIVCNREFKAFRRALIISVSAHLALFIFILISPYIPTHSKKGMIHYVNVVSFPGGGGGGGGGAPGPPPGEKSTKTLQAKSKSGRSDSGSGTVGAAVPG